jgi:riboflavin synthase
MFTGLITHIATTQNLSKTPESAKLVISADNKNNKLSDIKLGESIALNGVCLTVTNINQEDNNMILDFDISPETCDKTNLGNLKANDILNFERALTLNDRLGGHIVTGHVDGLGKVLDITNHQDYLNIDIQIDKEFMCFVAQKGSICVDGISLTVNSVDDKNNSFSVMIIPHTQENTNIKNYIKDKSVHIEVDLLARYVLRKNS